MTPVNEHYILKKETLLMIQGSTLFYPCSGNDLFVPIRIFSPFVTDFWFVDRAYFSPGHQDSRPYGYDAPADKQAPLLQGDNDYQLIDTRIDGSVSWNPNCYDISPCILTETYVHIPSKEKVIIHRRRGYGFSAFRKHIRSLGVFFYRGDSQGEGGSGNWWLAPDHVREVCKKLIDGGLIVTDGSQGKSRGEYHQFTKYRKEKFQSDPGEILQSVQPFTDKEGRTFTCVGYAGDRYGPTLIWQIKKPTRKGTIRNVPKVTRR